MNSRTDHLVWQAKLHLDGGIATADLVEFRLQPFYRGFRDSAFSLGGRAEIQRLLAHEAGFRSTYRRSSEETRRQPAVNHRSTSSIYHRNQQRSARQSSSAQSTHLAALAGSFAYDSVIWHSRSV